MNETDQARQAWLDYRALGPDRSLEKLARLYQTRIKAGAKVPTKQLSRLQIWSRAHTWQARLADAAREEERQIADQEAAYRRRIMESGYALIHERVKDLNRLARALVNDLGLGDDDTAPRFWLKDVKGLGAGDTFRTVEIERFNATQIEQLRKTLDDIARELGQRSGVHALTGADGGPPRIEHIIMHEQARE
jgi:hypothetical protein